LLEAIEPRQGCLDQSEVALNLAGWHFHVKLARMLRQVG
jgi:hypothetical protein